MGEDKEGTLAAMKTIRRELGDPKIAEHRGRIVKTGGDGLLVEFASVVHPVRCCGRSPGRRRRMRTARQCRRLHGRRQPDRAGSGKSHRGHAGRVARSYLLQLHLLNAPASGWFEPLSKRRNLRVSLVSYAGDNPRAIALGSGRSI